MTERDDNPQKESKKKHKKKPYYKQRRYQPPAKKKFWNSEKIVSLSAMAIALFTLVVLIYQSNILGKQYDLTVKQQKASVLPYLSLGPSYQLNQFEITLQNKGLGPAFVKGFYVQDGDSIFYMDNILDLYLHHTDNPTDSLIDGNYSSLFTGRVIAPDENLLLLSISGPQQGLEPVVDFVSRYFESDSLKFLIEYESVFEDSWIVGSDFTNKKKEEYGEIKAF